MKPQNHKTEQKDSGSNPDVYEYERPGITIYFRMPNHPDPENLKELSEELDEARTHFWSSQPESWDTCVSDSTEHIYEFYEPEDDGSDRWQYLKAPDWIEERWKYINFPTITEIEKEFERAFGED